MWQDSFAAKLTQSYRKEESKIHLDKNNTYTDHVYMFKLKNIMEQTRDGKLHLFLQFVLHNLDDAEVDDTP